jgi:hypothetical protein
MKQRLVHELVNAELLSLGGVEDTIGAGLLTCVSWIPMKVEMHVVTLRAFGVRAPTCIPNTEHGTSEGGEKEQQQQDRGKRQRARELRGKEWQAASSGRSTWLGACCCAENGIRPGGMWAC